jgi:hypothetical protein
MDSLRVFLFHTLCAVAKRAALHLLGFGAVAVLTVGSSRTKYYLVQVRIEYHEPYLTVCRVYVFFQVLVQSLSSFGAATVSPVSYRLLTLSRSTLLLLSQHQ